MAVKAGIHLSGEITGVNWDKEIPLLIEGVLNSSGKEAAAHMKSITKQRDSSGRFTDSITWQTAKTGSEMGSSARPKDKLEKPKDPYECWIGSGHSGASSIELGSSRHVNRAGTEEFIADLKDWARRELGIEPDGPPEDQFRFWRLVKKIREEGTIAAPYIAPTKPIASAFMVKTFRTALRKIKGSAKRSMQ